MKLQRRQVVQATLMPFFSVIVSAGQTRQLILVVAGLLWPFFSMARTFWLTWLSAQPTSAWHDPAGTALLLACRTLGCSCC